jgi:hypothetical protein
VDEETVQLLPITQKHKDSIELWMGNHINGVYCFDYSVYYELFYKNIQKSLLLESIPLDCSFWQDEPYLEDSYTGLPACYKDIDIVVNNCLAFSGQYTRDPAEMDQLCLFLNTKFRIVTTRKVEGILCTTDHNLEVKDIAAIATHAKYVVAIMSGPLCALNNKQTKASVKKWFIITGDGTVYIHSDIDYTFINNGNLFPIYAFFHQL